MIEIKKPEPKEKLIATTITKADHKRLEQIAKRHGMKIGGYLRELVMEQIKSELKRKLNF